MNTPIHVPSGFSLLWGALLIAGQVALGAGSLLSMEGSAVASEVPAATVQCVCPTA